MAKFDLNGSWTLVYDGEKFPAQVPGSLYHDLMQNNRLEDPYWRDNEMKTRPVTEKGAVYERVFTLPEGFNKTDETRLCCEGLDTLADIFVNGEKIGAADNMHRTWMFPLQNLRVGENTISVQFRCPVQYIRQRDNEIAADGLPDAMRGFPHIRKAHCMFGWDWGARLPDLGIWRDIYITTVDKARLMGVLISQEHKNGQVTLAFTPEVEVLNGCEADYTVDYTVTAPDGTEMNGNPITVTHPELWWPNGFGHQPLYTVKAELHKGGDILSAREKRVGLRTLTISRKKDEYGEEFCYVINGHKIFAMGADYIPEDHILPRMNPARTRLLLEDCVTANMNTIRVWGGGFYPADYFYDICDELGLLVWQDFMFACAVYEFTPDFKANVIAEIKDNVRRIRHHACIALWCGNNEVEMQIHYKSWKASPSQYSAYLHMFEHVFLELCAVLSPQIFYWQSSPSSGGGYDEPRDPNRGNAHYWGVWHSTEPFSAYRNYFFRFAAEFGFQSLPNSKTIESFTLPEDRNMFSYIMEKHQRNSTANGKIMHYLGQIFLYPHSFDLLTYASQLLQAEAIKYGVEHWRRHRGRCMGAIYWQLNDCWPVISWASVDYYNRWKALHYYAKRFFAPVLLSAEEEGVVTQSPNVNDENYHINRSVRFSVSNETLLPFAGEVRWALRNPEASIIREGNIKVNIEPLSAMWLDTMCFQDAPLYESYVSYALCDEKGTQVSDGTVLFCMPKQFAFADPKLTARVEGDFIIVNAAAYARSVEISCPDADILLEDNYFDMNGGERKVKILRGTPGTVMVRSVADIK